MNRLSILLSGLVVILAVGSASVHAKERRIDLGVGPGGLTGVYFSAGAVICQHVNQNLANNGLRCSARKALNTVDAVTYLNSEFDLAISLPDVDHNAINGVGQFNGFKVDDLRTLFILHLKPQVVASLVSSSELSDETVYALVSSVFNNFEAFKRSHPAFASLDPKSMIKKDLAAPLHDGAVRYYREKGWM